MNKPLVVVFAFVLALIEAPALADGVEKDSPFLFPPGDYPSRFGDPGYSEERAAAKEAAMAKWNKMTPEERAAAKKAARDRRLKDLTERQTTEKNAATKSDTEQKKQDEHNKAEQP
jgi:hypothetical protein